MPIENENLNNELENIPEDMDAVDIINQLKENSVSKERYDKLVAENRKLMKSLANGERLEGEAPKTPDIKELRDSLYGDPDDNECTNIEYITRSLALREANLEQNGTDDYAGPFATEEQLKNAQATAEVFQECLDIAKGDDAVFTAELQRHFKDAPLPMSKPGRR